MNNSSVRSAAMLGVLLLIGLTALGFILGKAAVSVKSLDRTVAVKGLSEREVPADIAIWPVAFQVAANDLNEIYNVIQTKNAIVVEFLEEQGIPSEAISFAPPFVTDLYAQQYGDKSNIKFRYTGMSTVTVYTDNVAAVRKAMSKVVDLGKRGVALTGQSSRSQFIYTGLNDLKPAMIEEATKNARTVAERFAADSDSKLGKIRSAYQGQFSIRDRDDNTPHIKMVRVVSTIEYYLSD